MSLQASVRRILCSQYFLAVGDELRHPLSPNQAESDHPPIQTRPYAPTFGFDTFNSRVRRDISVPSTRFSAIIIVPDARRPPNLWIQAIYGTFVSNLFPTLPRLVSKTRTASRDLSRIYDFTYYI
jgi:hypothetical protein